MNINLEALGLTTEDIAERVVDAAVEAILYETIAADDSGYKTHRISRIMEQVKAQIKAAVDAKISEIAATHVLPKIGEMISGVALQETNRFGESIGKPLTFIEYLAHRAETYMSEPVDKSGRSKAESDQQYDWKPAGPRLTVLMRMELKESLDRAAKSAVTEVNKALAEMLQQSAATAIAAAAKDAAVNIKA